MAEVTLDLKEYKKLEEKAGKCDYWKSMYELEKEEVERVKEYADEVSITARLLLFNRGSQFVSEQTINQFNKADKFRDYNIRMESDPARRGVTFRMSLLEGE